MKFFMISVGLILVLIIILLIGFLFITRKFRPNNCKNKFQLFLPTLMGVILFVVIIMSTPIGLDALDIMVNKTDVQNIIVSDLQAFSKLKAKDGTIYKYSSIEESPEIGKEYQVNVCKRTNFLYHFKILENVQ